jgi:ankyrin repeat protein
MKKTAYSLRNAINFMRLTILLCIFFGSAQCFATSNDDLITACMQGNLDGVKKAVEAGADVNFINPTGASPLCAAAFWPDIVQYLLSKKADPNGGKNMPLVSAATYDAPETMKILLDAGADPNKGTELNMNGVYDKMIADEEAKDKPNKTLLKMYHKMADKANENPKYSYALPSALTFTNNKECIEILLNKGAKIDNTLTGNLFMDYASSGKTAAERVAHHKMYAESLEKAGLKVPDWYKNADVAKQASPDEIVKILLKTGADINGASTYASPLLFCVKKEGPLKADEEVVMAFLNNGAKFDMDESNPAHQITPIMRVAALGYTRALTYMLDHGADQNAEYKVNDRLTGEDMKDVTPLMYAAEAGKLESVKLLLQRGANYKTMAHGILIDKVEKCRNKVKNKGVIFYAVESGNLELVKYLWENVKCDWERHRLEFDAITEETDMGAVKMTTIYHGCHNALLGYGPGKWAEVKGFNDIASYINSK